MPKYPISIKWSDEDNGYIATIPGIRGLSAFGRSQQEALSELNIAAKAYFQSLKKSSRPMPALEKTTSYSGQLRLRMPKSLHANLSQAADSEGVSLNTLIITLLSRRHAEQEFLNRIQVLEKNIHTTNSKIVSSAHNIDQSLVPPEKLKSATLAYIPSGRAH
jgi:predicted HicB family RNase H-like nuclease